jgi:hypothetical protein
MPTKFRVQHLDHSGTVVSTHIPVADSLTWGYKASDVGDIAYDIAFDDEALGIWGAISGGESSLFYPYQSDWRLQQDDGSGWRGIAAGIITEVNMVDEEDVVHVRGKDWAHWLEQPVWFDIYDTVFPTDPDDAKTFWQGIVGDYHRGVHESDFTNGFAKVPGGSPLIYAWIPPATQADIIQFLIQNSRQGTNYVHITTAFYDTAGDSTITPSLIIEFQDQTSILDYINQLGQMDSPYGFDWTMNFGKKMEFWGTRKNLASSPDPSMYIEKDIFIGEQPALGIDWTNQGPVGTFILGTGIAQPGLWWRKKDQDAIDLYRQWLRIQPVQNINMQNVHTIDDIIQKQIRFKTNGLKWIEPQKDVKIDVLPEFAYPLGGGFDNHIGDVVRVKWFFDPYHTVNAFYWITEQSFSQIGGGDWKCELGLQQIYS